MPMCRSAFSLSTVEQMIENFYERLSVLMKSGNSCTVPEGNDNLPCGICCHHLEPWSLAGSLGGKMMLEDFFGGGGG